MCQPPHRTEQAKSKWFKFFQYYFWLVIKFDERLNQRAQMKSYNESANTFRMSMISFYASLRSIR